MGWCAGAGVDHIRENPLEEHEKTFPSERGGFFSQEVNSEFAFESRPLSVSPKHGLYWKKQEQTNDRFDDMTMKQFP